MIDTPHDPPGDDLNSGGEAGSFAESLVAAITDLAEQERLRTAYQREIALRSFEVAEKAEQLEHELSLKRVEAENEQDKRRHVQVIIAICLGVGAPVGLLALILITAIFGSERQSQIALDVLRVVGIALGGGGFIFGVAYAISRLMKG